MSNPFSFYLAQIHLKTGYRASWEPGKQLKLGQVGQLDSNGVFTVYSTLEKEGIAMVVVTTDNGGDFDYTSNESVTIISKLSGTVPSPGSALTVSDAGITIEFKSSEAIVFQSTGNKTDYIENLGEITAKILEKYNNKNWNKSWLVITELTKADSATIIISNSTNGSLDLKANATVRTSGIKLTDASLGLTIAREKGSTLKYISQANLTPFYRVHGVIHPWFSNAAFETKSIASKPFAIADFKSQDLIPEELEGND